MLKSLLVIFLIISFVFSKDYYEKQNEIPTLDGVWGTKGTYSADNVPPMTELSNTWIKDRKLYLFGGNQYFNTGFRAMWEKDVSESSSTKNQWRWIHGPSGPDYDGEETLAAPLGTYHKDNVPMALAASGTANTVSNSFLMFGGGNAVNFVTYNGVWEFDPTYKQWRKLTTDTNSVVYGTTGVFAAENHPNRGAWWHFHNDGSDVFTTVTGLYSGRHFATQIWEFSYNLKQWRFLKGNKVSDDVIGNYPTAPNTLCSVEHYPASRVAPSTWVADGDVYMFGGAYYEDTDIFASLKGPEPFSGQIYFKSDMWKYDKSTDIWCWIAGLKTIDIEERVVEKFKYNQRNNPGKFAAGAVWVDEIEMLLYTGYGVGHFSSQDSEYPMMKGSNSVWVFDINQLAWKFTNGSLVDEDEDIGLPKKRGGVAVWPVALDEIYTFGGASMNEDGEIYEIPEVWAYTKKEVSCNGVDMDDSHVCGGHGVCSPKENTGGCSCTDGYSGEYCETEPVEPNNTNDIVVTLLVVIPVLLVLVVLILVVIIVVIGCAFAIEKNLRNQVEQGKGEYGNKYDTFNDEDTKA